MCLAIPGKIESIKNEQDAVFRTGMVSFDSIIKEINLSMVPEADINDYVLVHVGVAINKIDEQEAIKLLSLLKGEITDELGSNEKVGL